MRLAKVQKALKEVGIKYEYKEVPGIKGYVFGEIHFIYEGKRYAVDEISGNKGFSPSGIYTNINNYREQSSQKNIVEYILNHMRGEQNSGS